MSFIEWLIIIVAAIMVINPRDLPSIFKKSGRILSQIRVYRYQIQSYYYETLYNVDKPIERADKADKE